MFVTQCRVAEQCLSPLAPAIIVTIRAWHANVEVIILLIQRRKTRSTPHWCLPCPYEGERDCRTKTVRFRSVWDQLPCSLIGGHPGGGHESFEVNAETTDCEILLLRSALSMVLLEERLLPSACWATAPRMDGMDSAPFP